MAVQGNNHEKDGNNGQVGEPGNNEDVVEEYDQLDSQLDELNSALDILEQKNDTIQNKLRELLKSSIEIRELIKQENMQNSINNENK